MSKVAFLSLPVHGHVNPSLSLVKELADRGEEVIYYANPGFKAAVETTGAQYRRYSGALSDDISGLSKNMAEFPPFLMSICKEILDCELENIRRENFDYIIYDYVAPWGRYLSQALQLPAVCSVPIFAFNRYVFKMIRGLGAVKITPSGLYKKIRSIRKALGIRKSINKTHGLKGPKIREIYFCKSDLNIVYTSAYFQPFAETFDDSFHFTGPALSVRQAQQDHDFPWQQLGEKPLVYISLGTLFNFDKALFQPFFEAFANEDYQVILSCGGGLQPETFGDIPGDFIVQHFVPQLKILQRANVFITHGGMNSASEGLYYGVPLIALPQMAEQAVVAQRVEDLGAGIHLRKVDITPASLRKSVERILKDETYRHNARRVGDSFAPEKTGGIKKAVDIIFAAKQKWGIGKKHEAMYV